MKNSAFNQYSEYYNLIYKDKDYKKESDYIEQLIRKHSRNSKTILDVGCGTGSYSSIFAQKGYSVTGIDISPTMISIAERGYANKANLKFVCKSAQEFRFNKKFDAVVSLFHVMSYQTTNALLAQAFENIHSHLKSGGIFIFDFWYGPAVLAERPSMRKKILKSESLEIKRIAVPVLHTDTNIVDVNYTISIRDRIANESRVIKELHQMRYLFYPELEYFLENAGFREIKNYSWMKLNSGLDESNWNGVITACK